jgi:ubiquinone/menaquinone biosynthesis C-methylase UbiE
MNSSSTLGWGKTKEGGIEMWDADPVFLTRPSFFARTKLLFYPKKFFLYRAIGKAIRMHERKGESRPFRILDAGCGTGAAIIDLVHLFGDRIEVIGVDVIRLQVDIGRQKLAGAGITAPLEWYDGETLPFKNGYFDAVYTSDVLGHVKDATLWLKDIARVLRTNGLLAMFTESRPGRHAVVRRYLLRKGVNVDPHAEFHISLHPKAEIQTMLAETGFIPSFFSAGPALNTLLYPDEGNAVLQKTKAVPVVSLVNHGLSSLKKKLHPYSTALVELLVTIHFATIGRVLETQGYIVIATKRK